MKKIAINIVKRLKEKGFVAYFCGGCVRDQLLQKPPKDYDIVTNATPQEIGQIFSKTIEVGVQFGVIKILECGHIFELATFRKDGAYKDGRRPETIEFSDEVEDAKRRDFTINGMFYEPQSKQVIDYVEGQKDIEQKLVRTIGSPQLRFSEDYLRLMRAIRFTCQLDFSMATETWQTLQKMAPNITKVSKERIREELSRMLLGPKPAKAVNLLTESGMLAVILPEIQYSPEQWTFVLEMLKKAKSLSLELMMAILLSNLNTKTVIEICQRLVFSKSSANKIENLVGQKVKFANAHQMKLAELKKFLRIADFEEHLQLYKLYCEISKQGWDHYLYCSEKWQKLAQSLFPPPLITGDDLIQLGFTPGPIFKEILSFVENEQLEETIATRDETISVVKKQFKKPASKGD